MLVEVGPFLPVNLDADEGRIEDPGGLFVGEGLPLHDVAPVAGRVADGQEDGLVLAPGPFEGLVPPGVPIHGIVRVLEEVRAFFAGQAVGAVHFFRKPYSTRWNEASLMSPIPGA